MAPVPARMLLPEIRTRKSHAAPTSRRVMCNRLSRQGTQQRCMFFKELESTIIDGYERQSNEEKERGKQWRFRLVQSPIADSMIPLAC